MKKPKYALVAQLDRASDSDSEGRWFESSQARHTAETICFGGFFYMRSVRLA